MNRKLFVGICCASLLAIAGAASAAPPPPSPAKQHATAGVMNAEKSWGLQTIGNVNSILIKKANYAINVGAAGVLDLTVLYDATGKNVGGALPVPAPLNGVIDPFDGISNDSGAALGIKSD